MTDGARRPSAFESDRITLTAAAVVAAPWGGDTIGGVAVEKSFGRLAGGPPPRPRPRPVAARTAAACLAAAHVGADVGAEGVPAPPRWRPTTGPALATNEPLTL